MANLRHRILSNDEVVVLKISGAVKGADIFVYVRSIIESNPTITFYASIFDCRQWAGILFDDDVKFHIDWIDHFRLRHQLPTGIRPPAAYIAKLGSQINFVTAQIGAIRGADVFTAYTVSDAWSHVRPGHALPQALVTFLD
jgi:hypothetical protein